MNLMLLGGCCESRSGGNCCDDRDPLQSRRKSDEQSTLKSLMAQNCGVGVLFSVNAEGALTVAALVPGSPAEESNLVRVGDVLHLVDDKNVWCRSPQEVHRLVMGKEGTTTKLSFKMDGCHGLVHVRLTRRPVGAEERRKVVSQVATLKELSKARQGFGSSNLGSKPLGDLTNVTCELKHFKPASVEKSESVKGEEREGMQPISAVPVEELM